MSTAQRRQKAPLNSMPAAVFTFSRRLVAELSPVEKPAKRAALRRPPSRQSIPHNFHEFLGVRYAAVRRVEVAELAARLEAEPEPEPGPGAGVMVPPWAVVSKSVGGGWHGTTALDTRTGTVYAVWARYGTATLWRGIAGAHPGAVLYLERSERLRADGGVYKCPQLRPVKKLRPMQSPADAQVAVPVAGLTGLGL